VYRSGQPLIVPDYYNSPYSYHTIDEKTGFTTRNMIDVPMRTEDRMIGVLCAVNKKEGQFDQTDIDLLSTFASIVALPIENARINEELQRSYEEVKSLNRAKDQVIHRLSHELKTPVSVLSASLGLLTNKLAGFKDHGVERIIERSHRNLQRLLDMQYEIEDILRESDYRSRHLLSTLLDACADELEALVDAEAKDGAFVDRIRERIERLFGPAAAIPEEVSLDSFIQDTVTRLRPRLAHRKCELVMQLEQTAKVWIPPEVLSKIAEGLIRNAVENTPDGSRIEITVRNGKIGPEFEVRDFGVGITEENQRLLFESYFSAADTMQYATRSPYDFAAGGRGFDLLRMKIFSERYDFKIRFDSRRCRYIPGDEDVCPGQAQRCSHLNKKEDCQDSGGTTVTVQFRPAAESMI
jgi:signal transduction histidine kinase